MAINERKLTKAELKKREDIIMNMKKNKRDLVKKYGKDAEAVMYGRATNIAKKQAEGMKDPKLTELIKDALKNPKKADLNKDGKLSDYEKTRGAAIEKAMDKDKVDELIAPMMAAAAAAALKKKKGEDKKDEKLPSNYNYYTGKFSEDLDLGHEDNEPHMLKGDLYRIGKYAMELYKMVDQFEGMGEVDFPSWWQSKIFKAKDALVGAKHYLDFELKEPQIDAVVDIATDVVDEDISQLGTDDDTGFKASLYTPNEMGDEAVHNRAASGAFEENQQPKEKAAKNKNVKEAKAPKEISKREEKILKKIAKQLKGSVKAHDDQADKILKAIKEGLPKGYWDKKIDAEDEGVKEQMPGDPERFVGSGGDEIDSANTDNVTVDRPDKDAEIGFALDEDYDALVKKIEKQGKSKKAAKAIAGAVASYKAKGGGKGPTAKQKAR